MAFSDEDVPAAVADLFLDAQFITIERCREVRQLLLVSEIKRHRNDRKLDGASSRRYDVKRSKDPARQAKMREYRLKSYYKTKVAA